MSQTKQAPKKAAAKHTPKDDAAIKDRRRAYEHLGRVEGLHKSIDKKAGKHITALTDLAHEQLAEGRAKDAADLLRAAEHLSFGSFPSPKEANEADPKLAEEITKEFQHKLKAADEHWSKQEEHDDLLEKVYIETADHAQKFFDDGQYRQALELARAAEALAHVKLGEADEATEAEDDKEEEDKEDNE